MHRYRDAIYYSERNPGSSEKLKKEVIGGYILFPGDGVIEARPAVGLPDKRPEYLKSIDSVNIGAFPIKPGNAADVGRLEEFVQGLLARKVDDHLLGTPSQEQKGTERVREGEGSLNAATIMTSEGVITNDKARWIYERLRHVSMPFL